MNKKELMRLMHEQIYEEKRDLFCSLGGRGHYTEKQKRFAFELIAEHGMLEHGRHAATLQGRLTNSEVRLSDRHGKVGPHVK